MRIRPIRAGVLDAVPHGFLGREGGVSTGPIAGLNVGTGSDDDPERIAENRRRAVEAVLPGAVLATAYQVHSATAVAVERPWSLEDRPQADALVTDTPGILLGILTADCAPVLLADIEAGVIGAAHAGWKGALAGITDSAVTAMESLGAHRHRIAAAVGPCIAQQSYEVNEAFRARFMEADETNGRFFVPRAAGKPHFDLAGYVAARLAAAGVRTIETLGLDTYSDEQRFFSYRRSTHRGQADYGRQLSLIAIPHGPAAGS